LGGGTRDAAGCGRRALGEVEFAPTGSRFAADVEAVAADVPDVTDVTDMAVEVTLGAKGADDIGVATDEAAAVALEDVARVEGNSDPAPRR
jgi:hypothetical protein